MDPVAFCKQLVDRVSADEWRLLEYSGSGLRINEHNRTALLEMRDVANQIPPEADFEAATGNSPAGDVPGSDPHVVQVNADKAAVLEGDIQAYLDEHMADAPEGHKWIILASLYLTFVAKRPMHPIERAGVVVERVDGGVVYRCPYKVPGDNPICDSCVCVPKDA